MHKYKSLLILLILLIAGSSGFGALVLQDKKYKIVLPQNHTAAEKKAAGELAYHMQAACGQQFRTVKENELKESDFNIYIGHTLYAQKNVPQLKNFSSEEYIIKQNNNSLIISGDRNRGVLFAVYDLLENAAGIRWYSPDFTYIPKTKNITIPDSVFGRKKPAFNFRSIYIGANSENDPAWCHFSRRLRQNQFGNFAELGFAERLGKPRGVHTFFCYSQDLPVELSWMNKKGKREIVNNPSTGGSICFSLPEVEQHFIKKLREYIRQDRAECDSQNAPYPVYYCIDSNDGNSACYCKDCQDFIKKHGVSGLVINFLNKIAKNVSEEYPEIRIMTFAYHDSLQPPKTKIVPHKNLVIRLAPMDYEFFASDISADVLNRFSAKSNDAYRKLLDQWGRISSRSAIWGYWKMFRDPFPSPQSNATTLADYVRAWHKNKAEHIFIEMELDPYTPLSFFDLRYYLGCKLLFDPSVDVQKLTNEFMKDFYGSAAGEMTQLVTLIENGIFKENLPIGRKKITTRDYLNGDFFKTAYKLFDSALQKLSADPVRRKHVEQERLLFDIAYLHLFDKLKNPLGYSKADLVARSSKAIEYFAGKYPVKKQNDIKKGNEILQNVAISLPIPPALESKSFTELSPANTRVMGGGIVKDNAAVAKNAISLCANMKKIPDKYHSHDLQIGIYDFGRKKTLMRLIVPKKELPQDEKYHFYYIGRSILYKYSQIYFHRSWGMRFEVTRAWDGTFPRQLFDCFISMKVQGPSYVKNSKSPDDIRWDRVIFVRVNEDEPVAAVPFINKLDVRTKAKKASPVDKLKNKNYIDILPADINTANSTLIEDANAATKIAWTLNQQKDPKYHSHAFNMGLYDFAHKKSLARYDLPPNKVPQDGKYHFYYLGRTSIYRYSTFWLHRSWGMRFEVTKAWNKNKPDQLFDCYISLKLDGPSYVKNSKNPDSITFDRVILVPVSKDDPIISL